MYTKSILMSLALLISLGAQAFDKSTAYISSAELIFDGTDKNYQISDCGIMTHSQREGKIVIISYDKKINKQTIEIPISVRSRTSGLLCYALSSDAINILNLKGRKLGAILGSYRGVVANGAISSQVGYSIHFNESGVVLSDFASLFVGLGLKIGYENIVIDRISNTSNITISVTDQTTSQTQKKDLNMDDALQNISF
jgi:hypothetical protein